MTLSSSLRAFSILFMLFLFGCKKSPGEPEPAGNYFRCTINGQNLEMVKADPQVGDYPESLTAQHHLHTMTFFSLHIKTIVPVSKPCYIFSLYVYKINGTGTYKPDLLHLNLPLGPYLPNYYYGPNEPAPADVQVTISTYTRGTAEKSGRVVGKFKGTVNMRIPDDPAPSVPYEISGKFAAPLREN